MGEPLGYHPKHKPKRPMTAWQTKRGMGQPTPRVHAVRVTILSNTSIVDNCIVTYRTNDRIVFTRLTGRASSHRFIEESQANNSHTPTAVHSPFVVRGTAVDRPSIRHGHLCTRIPMHSIFDWLFMYHTDTSPSLHPCIPPQCVTGI